MASIDIRIADVAFTLRSDESEAHVQEVADLVSRRVESLRRKHPAASLHQLALLAALDFASHVIKGSRGHAEFRSAISARTRVALDKVEALLRQRPSNS